MNRYQVVVAPEGLASEEYVVEAEDEGKAKTKAMSFFEQPLRGETITYEVTQITEWPEIVLKSINLQQRLSEETPCYSAKLYVDGELFGEVKNHGHGGCDDFHPAKGKTMNDYVSLDKWVQNTYPAERHGNYTLKENLETLCHGIVWDSIEQRKLKRDMKKKTFFIDPKEPGNIFSFNYVGQKVIDHINEKYPGSTILPADDFDKAWKIYKGVMKK